MNLSTLIQRIPATEQRLVLNGRDLNDEDFLQQADIAKIPAIQILLRLDGGKGGFGSMLRALGAQRSGHETDDIEACRDISGRRLRHVNDEKKIAEWLASKKDPAEEEAERRRKKQVSFFK